MDKRISVIGYVGAVWEFLIYIRKTEQTFGKLNIIANPMISLFK